MTFMRSGESEWVREKDYLTCVICGFLKNLVHFENMMNYSLNPSQKKDSKERYREGNDTDNLIR